MIGKAGSSSVHHNKRNNQSSATSNYAYLWLVWAAHAGTWHLFGAHGEHDLKTTDEGTYRDPGDAMMAACMLMNFHPDASFSMTRIGGVG